MNKNRKLKKTVTTLAAVAIVGISSMGTTNLSFAQDIKNVSKGQEANQNVNDLEKEGITDISKNLNKIGYYAYMNELSGKVVTNSQGDRFKYDKEPISVNADMTVLKSKAEANNIQSNKRKPLFVGENTFTNNTSQPQTFTTSQFSKTVKDEVSTTVSKGFSVGVQETIKVEIPLLSSETTVSASFESSKSDTQTHSEERTLVASPQNINVPANKTYKAEVVLNETEYSADINFATYIRPDKTKIKYRGTFIDHNVVLSDYMSGNTLVYYDALFPEQKKEVGVKFASEDTIVQEGKAHAKGVTGGELLVKVYDVTNLSSPKLVETRTLN